MDFQKRRTLFDSLGLSVVDFRCRAHVEPEGAEEPNASHSIVFVRRGVFRRTAPDETLVADANHVLFFNAGLPYRYAHPLPGGDDCTILSVDTSLALEVVARHAPRDAERPEHPFRLGYGLSTPLAAHLHYELLAGVRQVVPERNGDERAVAFRRLALEDVLAELTDEAVRAAYAVRENGHDGRPLSMASRRRHRDLAEAVKLTLNEQLDSPPSLPTMARTFGYSPFHLSRLFHASAGMSLRRYVAGLRARLAAERLLSGARDLTALALDLGYADHSHFTNSFRHEWGLPPSTFRARYVTR